MFMMKGKINTYTCVTKVGTMRERIEERGVENSKLWLPLSNFNPPSFISVNLLPIPPAVYPQKSAQ